MAGFAMDPPLAGAEPMTLGSPTSPKPGASAQFLPGFLMGDLPAPVTPQPRALSGPAVGAMDVRSPLLAGQRSLGAGELVVLNVTVGFVLGISLELRLLTCRGAL
uniref:Uncharacterized protein n=1 Tax=Pavo cristatus TaxID=9049 RepID=A0A8C9F610_PAVCR